MPTLDWIGKKAVVNHHREVPYRLIHCDGESSAGDPDAGNLLVQGDNLEALKALLPYYAGKVKCIYIDPPYNTGNEGWVYNDNVASPEMKAWLGSVVGKEAEDLSRHDKWLCMMYPRLRLLKEFLAHDGVLFASCDENEMHNFKIMLDSIFGQRNYASTMVWNTEGNTDNQFQFKVNHEYILTYFKDVKYRDYAIGNVIDPNTPEASNLRSGFADNNITKNGVRNPPSTVCLPKGFPASLPSLDLHKEDVDEAFFEVATAEAIISRDLQAKYNISQIPVRLDGMKIRDGQLIEPCRLFSGWANARKLQAFLDNDCKPIAEGDDEIRFYLNRNGCIRYRKSRTSARNILSVLRNFGTTEKSRTTLRKMGVEFDYPKPVDLIKYLLQIGAEQKDAIVMDSFSGSGTTGEAVLSLNADDGLGRRFLLVEMDENIAKTKTRSRLQKSIDGYRFEESNKKITEVDGLGGGFRYCSLGTPLFNEFGDIDGGVIFPDLAAHVFFSETGSPLPHKVDGSTRFIGTNKGKAVYLLFSPAEQGFAREASGNVLTPDALANLPEPSTDFEGARVVYAEGCTVSAERLKAEGIIFKQIPYQIEGN
ncbi:MAG: site-specific DNA-methyltransferase [Sulfitobacter sp.]